MSQAKRLQHPAQGPGAEDIVELFRRVRAHPEFVFGTIFVRDDFAHATVPTTFSSKRATDMLAERGNQMIDDAGAAPLGEDGDEDEDRPCLLRVHGGGREYISFSQFAAEVVQEHARAEEIVRKLLRRGGLYVHNAEEPEYREVYAVANEALLRRQLEALECDAVGAAGRD